MIRLLALLCLVVAACGDDRTSFDAAVLVPDAGAPDAAVDRCETLCACTDAFCSQDMAECMTTCQTLEVSVRECRIEHCGYAQTNPSFHCPHALGDPLSPGVPPECIAP